MEYENDFINEDLVEFKVDNKIFEYKPTTAGDENSWMNEYMEFENGKAIQNLSKINECKIRNIMSVPYDKSTIKKIIGTEKEWKNLNNQEKWSLMSKLNPKLFDKIIIKINKIDSGDNKIKKN